MIRGVLAKLILIIGIPGFTVSCGQAPDQPQDQNSLWQVTDVIAIRNLVDHRTEAYFSNNSQALRSLLENAPEEISGDDSYLISLPLPDGSQSRFSIIESPVMATALAAKFPELKTYKVYGLDDPSASGRVDISPLGFHALLNTSQGRVTIDPVGDVYRVQSRGGGDNSTAFQCRSSELELNQTSSSQTSSPLIAGRSAVAQRISNNYLVYRLAVSATIEYVTKVGGTLDAAMAEITTAVNRVNQIYERDLGIRLQLIAGNDQLIETIDNGVFNNGNLFSLMVQNQEWVDAQVGSANYDIGHIFSTSNGGLAQFAVVCSTSKAGGATGLSNPTGETF